MAKTNEIVITVRIDDNGNLSEVSREAKEASKNLDKTTNSARTTQKGIKGVAATASAGGKNFAGMARGMDGLVGAYAAFAAQMFALTAAFGFLKRAGDLSVMQQGQVAYASATGVAMRTLTQDIISATGAQITFRDAAQAVAIGTAAGVTTDQLQRLGKAAKDTSAVLGRDVTDSFNRLIRGVTKAEPELLDELGIILRLDTASRNYAEALGKNVEDLSQFEKSQAVVNEVLEQSESKYSRILDITGGGKANPFAQLGKAFDDIQMMLQETILPLMTRLAKVFTDVPLLAIAAFSLLLKGPLAAMGFSMQGLVDKSNASAVAAKAHWEKEKLGALNATEQVKIYTAALREQTQAAMASKATPGAGGSAIMGKISAGTALSKREQAQLANSLTLAKTKLGADGKVISGIFQGFTRTALLEYEKMVAGIAIANKKLSIDTKVTTKGLAYAWAATAAAIKTAAAAIGTALMTIMSWAGWISIAATGIIMLYDAFKTEDVLTEEEQAAESLAEKIRSLTEDYKDLVAVQKIMTEDASYAGLIGIGSAIGNIAGAVNKAQFRDVAAQIEDITRTQKDYAAFKKRTPLLSSDAQEQRRRKLKGTEDPKGDHQNNLKMIRTQISLTKMMGETYGNYPAISKYQAVLEKVEAGIHVLPKELEQARVGVMELSAEFKALGELGKKSRTAMAGMIESFAPKSAEQNALKDFREELEATKKTRSEGGGTIYDLGEGRGVWDTRTDAAKVQDKRIKELGKEITFTEALGVLRQEEKTKTLEAATAMARAKEVTETTSRKLLIMDAEKLKIDAKILKISNDNAALVLFRATWEKKVTKEMEDANTNRKEELKALQSGLKLLAEKKRIALLIQDAEKANIQAGFLTKIIGAEKLITAEKKKQLDLINKTRKLEQEAAVRGFEKSERDFGFGASWEADKRKADFELKHAQEMADIRLGDGEGSIEKEKELKLAMLKAEYELLDAKRIQTEFEMLRLREEMKHQDPDADLSRINSLIKSLGTGGSYATTLGTAQEASQAFINAWASDEASKVLDNIEKLQKAKDDLTDIKKISKTIETSMQDGFETAFQSVITGTQSVKDAFLSMAQSILKALAQVLSEMMAVYVMKQLISGFGFGGGASTPSGTNWASQAAAAQVSRYGGIHTPEGKLSGYATGGIARGSQAGYPVMMHGTEAVVPLPNGKSIPVEMSGSGTNNISINVNMDSSGNSQTSGEKGKGTGNQLGKLLAAAVQDELHKQKRPGGLLSPLGATG
jgi:hypothetical protein